MHTECNMLHHVLFPASSFMSTNAVIAPKLPSVRLYSLAGHICIVCCACAARYTQDMHAAYDTRTGSVHTQMQAYSASIFGCRVDMSSLLSINKLSSNNPFKPSDDVEVSPKFESLWMLEVVVGYLCRVEYFSEPVRRQTSVFLLLTLIDYADRRLRH